MIPQAVGGGPGQLREEAREREREEKQANRREGEGVREAAAV